MTEMASAAGFRSLGQATSRTIVQRSAARGRLQRTLLVHGPAGSGKGAFVDDLLALLLCQSVDGERPCNACPGCRQARARTHPDLVIGSPERWRDDRSTGESIVAAARSWLADSAGAPIVGERRVILVEGVDRANEQTQNALLKALEEPTSRHMFVLVADEPARVLPTIRSRSQALRVGAVPRAELVAWLVDRERLPADQADALARIADGMPGTAIGFARAPRLVDWRNRTQRELLDLLRRGRADRFGSVRDLLEDAARIGIEQPTENDVQVVEEGARPTGGAQREAALLVVEAWLGLTRDLAVAAAGRPQMAAAIALDRDQPGLAEQIGQTAIHDFIELLQRIRDGLRQNAAPRLALEVAMLAWPTLAPR
ncbi:MAG: AAA family ATPase [Chloroflexota bacterium]